MQPEHVTSTPIHGRCGRPTKRGTPCTLFPTGPSDACYRHLDPTERAEHDRRRDEFWQSWEEERRRTMASDPACWTWDLPCSLDEYRARLVREGRFSGDTIDDLLAAWDGGFREFHQRRCAICGFRDSDLVTDHDHATGLCRGRLCRSCNTIEGMGYGGVFEKYRQRPPAAILGVKLPYTGYGWENGVPVGGWARYRSADDDPDGWKGAAIMAKIFDGMADDPREDDPHAA